MAQDRELSLEPQQVAFGRPIQLPLLGRGVTSIPFGYMARYGEGGEDERIGRAFRLAPSAVTNDSEHLATQGDGLLPDFEIADPSSHGDKMPLGSARVGINRMPVVPKPFGVGGLGLCAARGATASCGNIRL